MFSYEYKIAGTKHHYAAIEEAIRTVQFIRNKCLRKWMDERGVSKNDLQCSCSGLAKEYSFAARLNSQARQASADRAWFAISRYCFACKGKVASPLEEPRTPLIDQRECQHRYRLIRGVLRASEDQAYAYLC